MIIEEAFVGLERKFDILCSSIGLDATASARHRHFYCMKALRPYSEIRMLSSGRSCVTISPNHDITIRWVALGHEGLIEDNEQADRGAKCVTKDEALG